MKPSYSLETLQMMRFARRVRKFCVEKDGASLVEYGFLLALVALVVIGALTLLGQSISSLFSKVAMFTEGIGN
jgi:pilus assembly protein Flp/PilA